ncbi:stromal membrane-associated protein 1 [Platysternon megacephalum]|uniref:Stromal membrane-associated protein 1 n=1 Tax=Platysternon megacephalum TaxID=55544 RepID=A0A4D9F0C0_9SAUR|nr:stromal membrane-associated protein 1 [Platysternon megacephalum]
MPRKMAQIWSFSTWYPHPSAQRLSCSLPHTLLVCGPMRGQKGNWNIKGSHTSSKKLILPTGTAVKPQLTCIYHYSPGTDIGCYYWPSRAPSPFYKMAGDYLECCLGVAFIHVFDEI